MKKVIRMKNLGVYILVVLSLTLTTFQDVTAQSNFWVEDFTLPFGTKQDNGSTAWTTVAPVGCAVCPPDFEVDGNRFKIFAYGTEGQWISEAIDISGYFDVAVAIDAVETGNLDDGDYINFFYKLDGGPEIPFDQNGLNSGNFTSIVARHNGLFGATLQIVIRGATDDLGSRIYFDNVTVSGTPFSLPFDDIELSTIDNDDDGRLLVWDMNQSSGVTDIYLERSENGLQWEAIHSISGPFDTPLFEFRDANIYIDGETTFYRVRAIDNEGTVAFSNVVTYNNVETGVFKVYPNPTNGLVHYVLPKETYTIRLLNSLGQQVLVSESNDALGHFDLSDFENGIYIVQAVISGDVRTERIVKH